MAVMQLGMEAVKAFMAKRKAEKASPAKWLWLRHLLAFSSDFS